MWPRPGAVKPTGPYWGDGVRPASATPPARARPRRRPLRGTAHGGRLARAAGLSRSHFSAQFRRAFGESPHGYLLTRRLERAAALLRDTDRSVAEICVAVGLASVGSFTTSFGRAFGMSPTAYRAAQPPPSARALVPPCVLRAHGRPRHRTFREDAAATPT